MEKIGNTPLIRLKKIEEKFNLNCRLFAKLESENLSGSIKDRAAYQIIKDYQEQNILKNGSSILEATSGNTGISLAALGKLFDYHVTIVMPKTMSKQRQEMIKKYGAELVLLDGGMKQCHDYVEKLHKDNPNSIIAGQFENPSNIKAHILTTGPEIQRQCPTASYIFGGFGTGGTLTGLAIYFKNQVKIIAIEPLQSPLLTKGQSGPHLIQGIGANFIPNNFKKELMYDIICVDDAQSIEYAKMINEVENIYVGYSSGAALLGTINYIKKHNISNVDIVIIFPDKGDRYSWN